MLLRPVSSLFQIMFETFSHRIGAGNRYRDILHGLGVATTCISAWTPLKILRRLFSRGLAPGIIYVSVFLILTTVSFWFEDRIGVHPPVWNIIAFGRCPLSIYSGSVQFFLVLDYSVWTGVVLSERAHAGTHRRA